MITSDGINLIIETIADLVSHAEIELEDDIKRIELYKMTYENNTIKVYVLLDDTINGDITSIRIISKTGISIMERAETLQENTTKGLLIAFSMGISEVEE